MALHWDVTKLRNQENVFLKTGKKDKDGDDEEVLNPVIEALIWHQIITCTGGKITAKNYKEVFKRVWIWEQVVGCSLRSAGGKERPITLVDVERCVGLETNCFGDDGKRPFKEKVMSSLFEQSDRQLRDQEKKMKTTVDVMEESGA